METLPAMGRGPGGSALEEKAGRRRGGEVQVREQVLLQEEMCNML